MQLKKGKKIKENKNLVLVDRTLADETYRSLYYHISDLILDLYKRVSSLENSPINAKSIRLADKEAKKRKNGKCN